MPSSGTLTRIFPSRSSITEAIIRDNSICEWRSLKIDSALGMIKPGKYDKDIVRIFIRRVAETNIIFGLKHERISFISC
jgi:hypothetical protein